MTVSPTASAAGPAEPAEDCSAARKGISLWQDGSGSARKGSVYLPHQSPRPPAPAWQNGSLRGHWDKWHTGGCRRSIRPSAQHQNAADQKVRGSGLTIVTLWNDRADGGSPSTSGRTHRAVPASISSRSCQSSSVVPAAPAAAPPAGRGAAGSPNCRIQRSFITS